MTRPVLAALTCARAAAASAVLVGGLVLVGGWALDVAALRGVLPGLATMKANTALGLAGAGAALWLLSEGAAERRRRAGWICAALPVAVGLLTLAEYAFGWNAGVDELLFADPESLAAGLSPGRPAPNTAVALLLLGLALWSLDYGTRRGRRPAEALALAAGLIAFVGLLGYAYGVRSLYEVELYSSMALHTAALVLAIALGTLCARPRRGLAAVVTGEGPGGYATRRLLPAALFAPPILGGLRLAGERAGLYGFEFGLALFAASNAVVFGVLVWSSAHALARLDLRRRRTQDGLNLRIAALEAAANDVVITDREGGIVWVNPAFTRVTGYALEEVRGRNPRLLRSGEHDRAFFERLWNTILAGQVWHGEIVDRHKDGSLHPKELTITPVRDAAGEITHFVAIKQDIADRKRAEDDVRRLNEELEQRVLERTAALREEIDERTRLEDRFRGLFESAPDAIVVADTAGRIVLVNAQGEELFGYARDELIGRPIETLVPERFRGRHASHRAGYVAEPHARTMGAGLDLFARRKDGSEFPVDVSLSPVRTSDGLFVFSNIRNVAERRQTELRIRQLNEGLRARAAELEAVNKELEAFSYSVSHDLRAPLRAIDGFSRILLAKHSGALDAAARDYLERVRRAAQHMAVLIDDLLLLSRVTRAELARQDVDLSALAVELAEGLRKREPGRNVRFDAAPGLNARADPRLLRVALENLLGNAWKFTGRRAEARIEFGAEAADGGPAYFVRDNGAGFDMAYADKLFGAFQRLHDANEFPGTGIGLATVQRVVHKHGGRIWAEGAVDLGATFRFTLA